MTRLNRQWAIPTDAWDASLREMARNGVKGVEGIAFWLGRLKGAQFMVTHVVAVSDASVVKEPDLLVIPADVINSLTDLAIAEGVFLGGQIHSHGAGWTGLSSTDKSMGFCPPYYLSVVAPHFGTRSGTSVQDCGVHVLLPGAGFARLSSQEIHNHLVVQPGHATFVTVGTSR